MCRPVIENYDSCTIWIESEIYAKQLANVDIEPSPAVCQSFREQAKWL